MKELKNYINGKWVDSQSSKMIEVINPANNEAMTLVPAGCLEDVNIITQKAADAFPGWRDTPVTKRIQFLFKMKSVIEDNADEIARLCTLESGKTVKESKAEITRAIENIEVACGMPSMMQGDFSEAIARGIDEYVIRQPVGVTACITPFNFPVMIPFWYMPYALAAGNCFIVKPSEKVPETMVYIFELLESVGLPEGVLNLVNGNREVVDALLKHPIVKAVSFVGSTPVAQHIYSTASAHGKRVQAQGGAKNSVVIMPDADLDTTAEIVADSAFGCAGQRCLAISNVITIGNDTEKIKKALVDAAAKKVVGNGLDENVHMGPVITKESKERIENLIELGISEGAKFLLDGRKKDYPENPKGNFISPTILEDVALDGELIKTEVFGPVLSLINFATLEEAIDWINSGQYGNAASIFTNSGSAARQFRYAVQAGNVGVNIGVAAPMAFFPFSGWKDSFFGDLHAQAKHGVEFYTQTKVVIERWHKEWSRKF